MRKFIMGSLLTAAAVLLLSCSNTAGEDDTADSIPEIPASEPDKACTYAIECYKECLDGMFSEQADETIYIEGNEDTDILYTPKNIPGFTYDDSLTTIDGLSAVSGKISAGVCTIVRLYYRRNIITLSFDTEDGCFSSDSTDGTLTGRYGETISVPSPEKKGSVFKGWEPSVPETFPEQNTEYTAVWESEKYSIVYSINGGINNTANPSEYTSETDTITLAAPVRSGYAFDGWYSSEDYAGERVMQIEKGSAGTVTVYAKWIPDIYTIIFHPNGSSGSKYTQEFTYGTIEPLAAAAYSRKGYMFTGWNTDSKGTGTSFSDGADYTLLEQKTDLYAQWKIIVYDIIYVLNGGVNAPGNPQNFTVADATITLAEPEKDGYVFDGWYTNSSLSGSGKKKIVKGTTETITLYAKWSDSVKTKLIDTGAF
jgi:uncharacterized repeat protein (TIGR02543 family)